MLGIFLNIEITMNLLVGVTQENEMLYLKNKQTKNINIAGTAVLSFQG